MHDFYDISDEIIATWTSADNLASKNTRSFQGFTITDAIDGGGDATKEISLVTMGAEGRYPQHVHQHSDAMFVVTSGAAIFMSGHIRREVTVGERIAIPRGTPHGFQLAVGETFSFVSLQSPPIRNPHTGEEDFQLIDLI